MPGNQRINGGIEVDRDGGASSGRIIDVHRHRTAQLKARGDMGGGEHDGEGGRRK